ncbi:MAG: UDP-N-acetylmuramate dehydrogenase [Chitinophagaceae bacterium]|nr:UDP-N-acetylmuramate dehydrogenase [Chitinophagaceae bacterium]
MQLQQNISLKKFNTFGIDVSANYFLQISSVDELAEYFDYKKLSSPLSPLPTCILGGGSNILFTKNYEGVILKNNLKGITIIKQDENHIYIKTAAGENWHSFVMYCVANNFAGVENLSLIPGNVGASPMQNIGAYGIEIKDVFYELEAFDIEDKKLVIFNKQDCEFGYRESVFKRKYKGRFVITSVTFKLNKNPTFNTSYGAIEQELEKMQVQQITIQAVSQAVINIRRSKLPDPAAIGNAGSFFKNPTVIASFFTKLKMHFPAIVGYELPDGNVKLAAGWLIEQCGWKGYRKNDAGCHAKQALVLVNYGNAGGDEIVELSKQIIESVYQKFNVILEREVNII